MIIPGLGRVRTRKEDTGITKSRYSAEMPSVFEAQFSTPGETIESDLSFKR